VRICAQLAKARKVVAAVPAALATIRSSSNAAAAANSAAAAAVASPFAAAGAARPPLAPQLGAARGIATAGGTAATGGGESPDVQDLLSRIPPDYRADVARMLLASQEGPAKGGSG